MKYKIGDKVRIKSIDWYNENKDEYGYVRCIDILFTPVHSKYCGKVLTISHIRVDHYTMVEDLEGYWTDEMIECLVERNGKTYPYKIGDRVILKGNNRCATITDLKYNSWGNLSYYIKIDNDNDKDISTDYPTDLLLPYDNMVEGLVGEETKTKFKVGDVVYSKTWQRNVVIHEILPDCVYKVGDLFCTNWFKEYEDNLRKENMKPTTEYTLPDGYIFKDENGNVINVMKIVLEKKKKEYPKTYEECAEIIAELTGSDCNPKGCMGYMSVQLTALQKLLICRDAYWKIAGEEMGLGKPWEPDWNDLKNTMYGLYDELKYSIINPAQFTFPSKEVRDEFAKNFKKDIDFCK